MTEKELIEKLAEAMHSIWAHWMTWMFENGGEMQDGGGEYYCWMMHQAKYKRWHRQANTPYAELSEEEKESDRKVAKEHVGWLIADFRVGRQRAKLLESMQERLNALVAHIDWAKIDGEAINRLIARMGGR